MTRTYKIAGLTFLFFALYFIVDEFYFRTIRSGINAQLDQLGISHILSYTLVGIPIFTGAILINGKSGCSKGLGLDGSLVRAFVFALLCTLPMFVGFALFFDLNSELGLNRLLITVIAAGFFEELYFRGFLFGQLFRQTRFGFIPAVIVGAVLFGLIHLYQGESWQEALGVFAVTFTGGILFAWVYAEWNYNIWVPIFLHMLMNFSWELFNVSDTAFGGWYSNAIRLLTIATIIIFTIKRKRRSGAKLLVNRKTLWWQSLT